MATSWKLCRSDFFREEVALLFLFSINALGGDQLRFGVDGTRTGDVVLFLHLSYGAWLVVVTVAKQELGPHLSPSIYKGANGHGKLSAIRKIPRFKLYCNGGQLKAEFGSCHFRVNDLQLAVFVLVELGTFIHVLKPPDVKPQ